MVLLEQVPFCHFPCKVCTLAFQSLQEFLQHTYCTNWRRKWVNVRVIWGLLAGGKERNLIKCGGRRPLKTNKTLHSPLSCGQWYILTCQLIAGFLRGPDMSYHNISPCCVCAIICGEETAIAVMRTDSSGWQILVYNCKYRSENANSFTRLRYQIYIRRIWTIILTNKIYGVHQP